MQEKTTCLLERGWASFYAELPPPVPPTCVLRFAAEELRAGKEVVLASVARSGYEFEFEAEALGADAYVAAWAACVCVCAPWLAAQ